MRSLQFRHFERNSLITSSLPRNINYASEFRVTDNAIVFVVCARSCPANNANSVFVVNTVRSGKTPGGIDFN